MYLYVCELLYKNFLQLKKANVSDTEAPCLDFHLSISNGFVYYKRDDSDFDIVKFPLTFFKCRSVGSGRSIHHALKVRIANI